MSTLYAELTTLTRLGRERKAAWEAFNYKQRPGKANDWPCFAQANAKWLKTYRQFYGREPEPDEIDLISTRYFNWFRYSRKNAKEQPPEYIWKGGEAPQAKVKGTDTYTESFFDNTDTDDY